MRLLIKAIMLLMIFTSCASGQRYMYDRAMDARDIINVGIERNIYGASISIIPISLALQHAASGKGFGIRYGHFGTYETGDDENLFTVSHYTEKELKQEDYLKLGDAWLSYWVTHFHQPTGNVLERNRRKGFKFVFIPRCWNKYIIDYQGGNYRCGFSIPAKIPSFSMEVSAGAYLGVRVGINLPELIDFLAGIIGYDLLDDDLLSIDPYGQYLLLSIPNAESSVFDKKMDKRTQK